MANENPIVPIRPVVTLATPSPGQAIPGVQQPAVVGIPQASQPIAPSTNPVSVVVPQASTPVVPVVKQPCGGGGGESDPPLTPRIIPISGSYRTDLQPVSFESDDEFIGFYYTLDGSDPRTNGLLWNENPITITQQGAMEIRVAAQGYNGLFSEVFSATYIWTFPTALAPVITPASGTYTQPHTVFMSSPQGLQVRYTTNGTEPTAGSPLYTDPLELNAGVYDVRAKCFGSQFNPSPTTQRNYTVNVVTTLALAVANGGRAWMTTDENLVSWTELRPLGNTSQSYQAICASRSSGVFGKFVYVGIQGLGCYKSDDFGSTWTLMNNLASSVTCDATGQYVYVWAQGNAVLRYSSDYGASFSTFTFAGSIQRISCSDTGDRVYASLGVSRFVWVSSNFGASFTQLAGIPSPTSIDLAIGSTGQTFFTSQFSNPPGGLFNKWTNFGSNRGQFQLSANPQSYVYTRISCDKDAQAVITCRGTDAAIVTGRVYMNITGGNQTGWFEVAPTGTPQDLEWRDVATNGQRSLAANTQRIYASVNSGSTWFEIQPAGNVNQSWWEVQIYRT